MHKHPLNPLRELPQGKARLEALFGKGTKRLPTSFRRVNYKGWFFFTIALDTTTTPEHRRMKHRLIVQCNHCGKYISAGRLDQHLNACMGADK